MNFPGIIKFVKANKWMVVLALIVGLVVFSYMRGSSPHKMMSVGLKQSGMMCYPQMTNINNDGQTFKFDVVLQQGSFCMETSAPIIAGELVVTNVLKKPKKTSPTPNFLMFDSSDGKTTITPAGEATVVSFPISYFRLVDPGSYSFYIQLLITRNDGTQNFGLPQLVNVNYQ